MGWKTMGRKTSMFTFLMLVGLGTASPWARAANLTVNCDKKETIHRAVKILANSNPQGPNTISVVGSCSDNLLIQGMDRLTLITKKGASITDRSEGQLAVVDIEDSRSITVQGFTINGGNGGVICNNASVCYLTANTIQDSAGIGVSVNASRAFLESNVIQNHGFRGATLDGSQVSSSNDVFQNNAAQGMVAGFGAYFLTSNSSFLNNAVGIEVPTGTVRLRGGTISGNRGDGMILLAKATAVFQGPAITGNGGNGVHLEDGSFAGFIAANITGNSSGTDVDCAPQFPVTRFVERTGGITNCVESASASAVKAVE